MSELQKIMSTMGERMTREEVEEMVKEAGGRYGLINYQGKLECQIQITQHG